ncbi:MAG: DUF438 domain-containing protein [Deltaproteobacteria bacterium]|nr:DUF438 domain-containing protein [Deltaproteobacteria bacterium]
MGRIATLKMASEIAGIDVNKFIEDIKNEIARHRGEAANPQDKNQRQIELKNIIKDLHRGVPFEEVKKRFDELIKDIDASEIAAIEESLIREGMPVSEIQRLCDLHVNVFRDILNSKPSVSVPESHPLYMYQRENRELQSLLQRIQSLIPQVTDKNPSLINELRDLIIKIQDINFHYLRKENQLFPYLERYGFTGPSQVMWGIHNEIRKKMKEVLKLIDEDKIFEAVESIPRLIVMLSEMIFKEENILFPTALNLLSDKDWDEIRKGEKDIGFAFIGKSNEAEKSDSKVYQNKEAGVLNLSTGVLSLEQLDSILTALPVDISFVDENDEVRYYSDNKDRIFPRSPGVIGRKVQMCHPPKSVYIVEKILNAFKKGEKDVAEFYVKLNGRDIHIRYFAVRDKSGRYLGTLEVSQDITEIKKLSKEKRLLEWE